MQTLNLYRILLKINKVQLISQYVQFKKLLIYSKTDKLFV